MARLLLLRHGQSTWNAEGRWQGWADPPLSPTGEAQAVAAADRLAGLGLTGVVSSDLLRARQTAAIVAERLDIEVLAVEPGLRERDIGDWSGLTTTEIEQGWPGALGAWRAGALERPPNGEAFEEIAARVMGVLERLADGDGSLLVVTHGGVIHLVQRHLGCETVRMGNVCGRWLEPGMAPGELVLVDDAPAGIAL